MLLACRDSYETDNRETGRSLTTRHGAQVTPGLLDEAEALLPSMLAWLFTSQASMTVRARATG